MFLKNNNNYNNLEKFEQPVGSKLRVLRDRLRN